MDNSKKTPLQLLAQTCNNIGLPDPPSKSKSILPLNETAKPSTATKSAVSDSANKFDKPGVGVKILPHICRTPDNDTASLTAKSEKRYSPGGTSPAENGVVDFDGHRSPKRETDAGLKVTPAGHSSTVGQALPPTLPPTGVAPKCGGCVTPYPSSVLGSYPLLPPNSAGNLPYPQGLPAPPPGAYSASLHAAAAAAAASMPPFSVPPCREPYCRVCPPTAGLGTGASGMMNGGRCPLGCLHCTPSAHELFWLSAAASHPFLAAGGGFPGLPSAAGLPNPAVSMAGLGSFGSLYNHSAFAAAALAVNSATSPLQSAAAVGAMQGGVHHGSLTPVSAAAPTPAAPPAPPVVPTTSAPAGSQPAAAPSNSTFSCSWGTGDTLCGKRFANADDLREHLSSHVQQPDPTSGPKSPLEARTAAAAPPASSSAPALPPTASTPQGPLPEASTSMAMAGLPPLGMVTSTPGGLPPMSVMPPLPTSLGRPYSPRSMLAVASFNMNHRYHPYKSPMGSLSMPPVASGLGAGPLGHLAFPPGLNPAALGYASLYGQRLPGSLPHP